MVDAQNVTDLCNAFDRKVEIAKHHYGFLRCELAKSPKPNNRGFPPVEFQAAFEGTVHAVVAGSDQLARAANEQYDLGLKREHCNLQPAQCNGEKKTVCASLSDRGEDELVCLINRWWVSSLRVAWKIRNASIHGTYCKTRRGHDWILDQRACKLDKIYTLEEFSELAVEDLRSGCGIRDMICSPNAR